MTTAANAAAHYLTLGWYVFPIHGIVGGRCTCRRRDCDHPGKHPVRPGGFNGARNDAACAVWWVKNPTHNIGIATEPSGLAVVDVDADKGGFESLYRLEQRIGQLPETLITRTGGGGWHLIYTAPPTGGIKSDSATFKLPGIDTRGRRGCIVAPPSLHISGERYEFPGAEIGMTTVGDLAPWPDILTRLMEPPQVVAAPTSVHTGTGYAAAAMRDELERLAAAPPGTRNTALNRAAFALGQLVASGHLNRSDVERQLHHTALNIGLGDGEATKTIHSGLRCGGLNPRTVVAA